MDEPKEFRVSDQNNILRSLDKSFEDLCTALNEIGIQNPKKLTLFELLAKKEYFEKKAKKNKKQ